MFRNQLVDYNASLLQTNLFKDYCPNGLQVEGKNEIKRIATAVTASQFVIDAAIAWGADAILVHHGYFWRNEEAAIVGLKKRRLAQLLRHDVNLLAYHLPLDAHPELGNNAQLGRLLDLVETRRCGEQNLVCLGRLRMPQTVTEFAELITQCLGRTPLVLGDQNKILNTAAWCSGGAQGYFGLAIEQGADVYLTGEVSEQQYHLAQETGAVFIAAGHHVTERYGIQTLGEHLAQQFDLQHQFFDQANPV